MPRGEYQKLPNTLRDELPTHAQHIYEKALNAAYDEYSNPAKRRGRSSVEETAHKVAWSAVKKEYRKGSDGQWHPKEGVENRGRRRETPSRSRSGSSTRGRTAGGAGRSTSRTSRSKSSGSTSTRGSSSRGRTSSTGGSSTRGTKRAGSKTTGRSRSTTSTKSRSRTSRTTGRKSR